MGNWAIVTAATAMGGRAWAKWIPYWGKANGAVQSRQWSGDSAFAVGGVPAGDAPSCGRRDGLLQARTSVSIWKALLVAVLRRNTTALYSVCQPASACCVTDAPRAGWYGSCGAVAATPSMMCTCCTAPVVRSPRKNGATLSSAVAYWKSGSESGRTTVSRLWGAVAVGRDENSRWRDVGHRLGCPCRSILRSESPVRRGLGASDPTR